MKLLSATEREGSIAALADFRSAEVRRQFCREKLVLYRGTTKSLDIGVHCLISRSPVQQSATSEVDPNIFNWIRLAADKSGEKHRFLGGRIERANLANLARGDPNGGSKAFACQFFEPPLGPRQGLSIIGVKVVAGIAVVGPSQSVLP